MQDPVFVAESGTHQELVHEAADCHWVQRASIPIGIHVLLQIALAVFENEHEFGFGVDHIVQADYVDMLELLHQGDLADGCRRGAFFRIEMDFLQRYDLVCRA